MNILNKAEPHSATAASSGSDRSLSRLHNACAGHKQRRRLHGHLLCQLVRTLSLPLIITLIVGISSPAKFIKPENGVLSYCTQAAAIQPDLFHLQMDTMAPARLLRGKKTSERRQTPERQTENKVTAETQAVLNITKPPAAHTTQLSTST